MSFGLALALLSLIAAIAWGWAAAALKARRVEHEQTEKFIGSSRGCNMDPLSYLP
jgi:hypothetical protein